jgi:hypothetical protein
MYVSGGGNYRPKHLDKWRAQLKRRGSRNIEQFAELLSEGYTITEAAHALGLTQQTGSKMFKTIREELGSQAI